MTPQQANELPKLPAPFGSIDIYTNDGMVRSVDGFTADQMRGYALDYARRAPAPTEPAVDRDIGQLNTYWLTADGVADQFVRVSDVQAYLATPASPAVPGTPRFKDHDIRQLVNDLRAIAIEFHAAGQLRERISGAVQQFLAGPQVAQASQPTSAEELQQKEHIPPFAEPASQHEVGASVLNDERIITLACAEVVNDFETQDMLDFARAIEAELASRCRAQGGITNDSKGLPTSAEGKDSERLEGGAL